MRVRRRAFAFIRLPSESLSPHPLAKPTSSLSKKSLKVNLCDPPVLPLKQTQLSRPPDPQPKRNHLGVFHFHTPPPLLPPPYPLREVVEHEPGGPRLRRRNDGLRVPRLVGLRVRDGHDVDRVDPELALDERHGEFERRLLVKEDRAVEGDVGAELGELLLLVREKGGTSAGEREREKEGERRERDEP